MSFVFSSLENVPVQENTPVKKEYLYPSFKDFLRDVQDAVRPPNEEEFKRREKLATRGSISDIELQPLPHQERHLNKMLSIFERHFAAIDVSPTGLGKTVIQFMLAKRLNLSMLVICPKTVEGVWRSHADMFGIQLIDVISYNSLAGTGPGLVGNGLLRRKPQNSRKTKKTKSDIVNLYEGTDHLYHCFNKGANSSEEVGTLVVFDEFHMIKHGDSLAFNASLTIARAVQSTSNCYSRISLVSASPFDNAHDATQTLMMLGVIKSNELYKHTGAGKYTWMGYGIEDILQWCYRHADEIGDKYHLITPDKYSNFAAGSNFPYFILKEVLKDIFVSRMDDIRFAPELTPRMTRALVPLPYANANRMAELVSKFARFRPLIESSNSGAILNLTKTQDQENPLKIFTMETADIEALKVPAIYEMAMQILTIPGPKVVIALRHTEGLEKLYDAFSAGKPLTGCTSRGMMTYDTVIIAGSFRKRDMKREARDAAIRRFQTDPTCRICLIQVQAGGVGISLHDTVGDSPRVLIAAPFYSIQTSYQVQGRISRTGTLSRPFVIWVYSALIDLEEGDPRAINFFSETRILELLRKKGDIIHSLVDVNTTNNLTAEEMEFTQRMAGNQAIVLPSDLEESNFTDLAYNNCRGESLPSRLPRERNSIMQVVEEVNKLKVRSQPQISAGLEPVSIIPSGSIENSTATTQPFSSGFSQFGMYQPPNITVLPSQVLSVPAPIFSLPATTAITPVSSLPSYSAFQSHLTQPQGWMTQQ